MSAHRRVGLISVAALLAVLALLACGSGPAATPPIDSWTELDAWYVRAGPAVAVVALLRVPALAAAGWLVAAGGLQLLAAVCKSQRFSAVVDAVSPGFVRALARSAAGLSVTAGLAVPVLPSGTAGNPPGTAVMVPLDAPAPSSTTTLAPSTASTTPTTVPTTSTTAPATTTTTTAPQPADPAASPSTAGAPAARGGEVVVARGDSFWSIAVDEAGEREVVDYWRTLIEVNRDRLVDRSNPDLLYPGQVLRLP